MIAERLGSLVLSILANHRLGAGLVSSGELRMGEAYFRRNLEILPPDRGHERFGHFTAPLASAHAWLAGTCADLGRFSHALEHGHEAIRVAERLHHPRSTVWAYYALGYAHCVRGDFAKALPPLERAQALVEEWEVFVREPVVWGALGYARARSGGLPEGLALLERAGALSHAKGRITRPYVSLWLAETLLLAGRIEEASMHTHRALLEMREHGQGRDEGHALRLLGEIASHRTPADPEPAESWYREALARADAWEMRPLVARCRLDLGALYERTGQREQARLHIVAALGMLREMGMPYWLETAEAMTKDLPWWTA